MTEWHLAVDAHDRIGEWPAWNGDSGTLLWVDIAGKVVQRLDPATGRTWRRELDQMVGAVLPRASGGLALCLQDGVDRAAGVASGRRALIDFEHEMGLPDGMTVDAEGFLWVAFYGGWSVDRVGVGPDQMITVGPNGVVIPTVGSFAPDGRLDRTIELPVERVTSCAFGGPDLADVYITSASDGLTDDQLRAQPMGGGIFMVRPGVHGLPIAPFAG